MLVAWPGHQIVAVASVWTYGFVLRLFTVYLAQPHMVICSFMLMRLTPLWLPFAARARPFGAAARGREEAAREPVARMEAAADDGHKMAEVQARL